MSLTFPTLRRGPQLHRWRQFPIVDWQHRIREIEARTSRQRIFDPELIPGLLQTPDYATGVLTACVRSLGRPDDDIASAVTARMARHADWQSRQRGTHFLLGEQALYTKVGTASTMEFQLRRLLEAVEQPPVGTQIGIVPRAVEFTVSATNFVLYDNREARVETTTSQLKLTRKRDISDYEKTFEMLAAQSVMGPEAARLLTEAIAFHTT